MLRYAGECNIGFGCVRAACSCTKRILKLSHYCSARMEPCLPVVTSRTNLALHHNILCIVRINEPPSFAERRHTSSIYMLQSYNSYM